MLEQMAEEAIKKSASNDTTDDTTIAIARNPKTPTYILEKLLTHYWSNIEIDPVFFRDDSIRCESQLGMALASNPNTSEYILDYLVNLKGKEIVLSLARDAKTSESLLTKIASIDNCDRDIVRAIITNPNTTRDILALLSNKGIN